MIEVSDIGNIMIKAKSISIALGYKYKKSNETFVIKKNSKSYNNYRNSKLYFTYTNGTESIKKSASNAAFTSKISNCNLCQVSTLSTLVNYKYFISPNSSNYTGYNGIICFSKYNKIPSSIPASTPAPTRKPTPTPIPEPTSIMIEGVEFKVKEHFLSAEEALSDWGGAMIEWKDLESKVDGSIIDATDLIIESESIEFTHLVKGSDCVSLVKADNGYKISISVKLTGSVLCNQNASIVKAMVSTISSKPVSVYTAIFESFTSNNSHGINEDKYVAIGDCKIKVEIKNNVVSYLIKKA